MNELVSEITDRYFNQIKHIYQRNEPECISWYINQPEDLLSLEIVSFSDYVSENYNDAQACENYMQTSLAEIERFMSFHKQAKEWADQYEKGNTEYNKEISPRMRNPEKIVGLEHIGKILYRSFPDLLKIKENK